MIDPELKSHLEKIEDELSHMRKVSTGIWHTLWRGCIYGAGYVVGAVLIIVNRRLDPEYHRRHPSL